MQNYFALSAPKFENNELDFSPIQNALSGLAASQRQRMKDTISLNDRQNQRERQARQDALATKMEKRNDIEWYGKRADAISRMQPSAAKSIAWRSLLAGHPDVGSLTPEYLDPEKGPQMVAAEAGIYNDPIDMQLKRANLEKALTEVQKNRLENNFTSSMLGDGSQGTGVVVPSAPVAPTGNAQEQPLTPGYSTSSTVTPAQQKQSTLKEIIDALPPGQREVAMGAAIKKDMKTLEKIISQNTARQGAGEKIAGGLKYLKSLTDQFDDNAFENALGPYAGADPFDWKQTVPVTAARLSGEIANVFSPGQNKATGEPASLSELRDNVIAGAETVAATIKPLIRAPGEGPFSDTDQRKLNSIVGNLAASKTKAEFKRRLNQVRDRVKENFGIDIPFEAIDKPQQVVPQVSTPATNNPNGFQYMGTP